jgi:cell division septal protein FtsQ
MKELIDIKENDKWRVILGDDTFTRATKAIESLNKKLSNDNEECEAEIEYLIS